MMQKTSSSVMMGHFVGWILFLRINKSLSCITNSWCNKLYKFCLTITVVEKLLAIVFQIYKVILLN